MADPDTEHVTRPNTHSQRARSKTAEGEQVVLPAVGKVARYSSHSDEFAPKKTTTTKLSTLVSRLYTPDLLLERTQRDLEERKKKARKDAYDALNDPHLCGYWSRQVDLFKTRQRRGEVIKSAMDAAEKGETEKALMLLDSTRPQSRSSYTMSRPNTRGGTESRLSSSSFEGASPSPAAAKRKQRDDHSNHRNTIAAEHEGGDGGNHNDDHSPARTKSRDASPTRSSRSASSSRSYSSSRRSSRSNSSASSRYSSPDRSKKESASTSKDAPSPNSTTKTRTNSGAPPSREETQYSADEFEAEDDHSADEDKVNRTQPVSVLEPSAAVKKENEGAANDGDHSPAAPRSEHSHGDGTKEGEKKQHHRSEQRSAQSSAQRSQNRSREGALVVHSSQRDHDLSRDVLLQEMNCFQRRDLTALWLLADPAPQYLKAVVSLKINVEDFNLSWLAAKDGVPPLNSSIFHIPQNPDFGDDPEDTFTIGSPRSCIVMLRNGVSLQEVVPKSLLQEYNEASLQGAPGLLAEKRFTARERIRKSLLAKIRADYGRVCTSISQETTLQLLRMFNPAEHPDFPIRNDTVEMTDDAARSSNLSRKLSFIASTAEKMQMESRMRLKHENDKVELYLKRSMEIEMARVQAANARAEREREKEERAAKKAAEEAEARKQRQKAREEKLNAVRLEGKLLAAERRNKVLETIQAQDQRIQETSETRALSRMLQEEEHQLQTKAKHLNMLRRERIHEYEKLLTLDRIRRKIGKVDAADNSEKVMRVRIRFEMDESSRRKHKSMGEYQGKILEYQRRFL